MKKEELMPLYDKAKSFYGKAVIYCGCMPYKNSNETVSICSKNINLFSYDTHVCYIDKDKKVHLLPKWNFSATTLRHVKEFLKQNGFKAETKKQIEKDYWGLNNETSFI